MVFETPRLIIRKATASEEDVNTLYNLWTNPDVMRNVGFPKGLRITREQIKEQLLKSRESEYNHLLLVETRDNHEIAQRMRNQKEQFSREMTSGCMIVTSKFCYHLMA